MTSIRNLAISAAVAAALVASAGASFAASTTYGASSAAPAVAAPKAPAKATAPKVIFTMGKAGTALSVVDLTAALSKYDPALLGDFDKAKTVTVYNINRAYTGADKTKAVALLTADKADIAELRTAIGKDAVAMKMLKSNHLRPSQVVGITDSNGAVSLYIL